MSKAFFLIATVLLLTVVIFRVGRTNVRGASFPAPDGPRFDGEGNLLRPVEYRRSWVFLSSGFGMSYSRGANGYPQFTNVFVNPSSYDSFVANGKWPDKTVFVLEEYESASRGSINKGGSYQEGLAGLVAEVKDEGRFPDKWAYFQFGAEGQAAKAITPAKNVCWNCHEEHAAVEHSFVQFYPELLKIARAKGTIKPGAFSEK